VLPPARLLPQVKGFGKSAGMGGNDSLVARKNPEIQGGGIGDETEDDDDDDEGRLDACAKSLPTAVENSKSNPRDLDNSSSTTSASTVKPESSAKLSVGRVIGKIGGRKDIPPTKPVPGLTYHDSKTVKSQVAGPSVRLLYTDLQG
jgi:hypothetical protein